MTAWHVGVSWLIGQGRVSHTIMPEGQNESDSPDSVLQTFQMREKAKKDRIRQDLPKGWKGSLGYGGCPQADTPGLRFVVSLAVWMNTVLTVCTWELYGCPGQQRMERTCSILPHIKHVY